ncbi:MAG: class I SAM-dependent DNA methyltransferase [Solirubrobacteraceae bacterium]
MGLAAWWLGSVVMIATPRAIAALMADLTDPDADCEIYDPCCGTGRLLVAAHRHARARRNPTEGAPASSAARRGAPRLYGQELNPLPFVLARLNAAFRGLDARFAWGDVMRRPAFLDEDGSLKKVDVVVANPMWNQSFPVEVYEQDRHRRFGFGIPPTSDGDWGWIQHMHSALRETGRMAVVLDAEFPPRGSNGNGHPAETAIKRAFVGDDLIEAVLACDWPAHRPRRSLRGAILSRAIPTGVMLVVNRLKRHPGEVLMLETGDLLADYCAGTVEAEDALGMVLDSYRGWRQVEGLSAVVSLDRLAEHDFDLSPSVYVRAGATG